MHPRIPKQVRDYFKSGAATQWWDTEVKPLGEYDRYILEQVYKKGCVALDVGSGKGRLAVPLAKLGMQVVALDISSEMLSFAQNRARKYSIDNIMFVVADAENLPFINQTFDSVLCIETLVHLPNPDKTMTEISCVVRHGGIVAALVDCKGLLNSLRTKDFRKFVKFVLTNFFSFLIPKLYKDKIIWKGFSQKDFISLFNNAGLSLLELKNFKQKYLGISTKA